MRHSLRFGQICPAFTACNEGTPEGACFETELLSRAAKCANSTETVMAMLLAAIRDRMAIVTEPALWVFMADESNWLSAL
jgi:hypothetical protein